METEILNAINKAKEQTKELIKKFSDYRIYYKNSINVFMEFVNELEMMERDIINFSMCINAIFEELNNTLKKITEKQKKEGGDIYGKGD